MSELFGKEKKGFFSKLKISFKKNIIDEEFYEELLETLIRFDIPYDVAVKICDRAKKLVGRLKEKEQTKEMAMEKVAEAIRELLSESKGPVMEYPAILLVCGVNGVGKTTTIAKLANKAKNEGKSVMRVCGDTFRAAVTEQLSLWGEKISVPVIKGALGQDPSGVIFDGIASAKSKKIDLVICDSAGRVAAQENLMRELEKIYRICEKNKGDYNLYVLLVLDGQNGSNSLAQAKNFQAILPLDGYVMTKVDGAGKGGVVLCAKEQTGVDVWYLGTGEALEDIVEFDKDEFTDMLFEK